MQESPRLRYRETVRSRAQGLLVKAAIVLGTGVVFVSAIAVSLALFAIALASLCVFGGYFWWKTRHIRKQLRTRFEDDDVIEGVVIRERIRQTDE